MLKKCEKRVNFTTFLDFSRIFELISPPLCRGCGRSGKILCDCCKYYIVRESRLEELEELEKGVFSRAKFLGVRDGILGEMVEEYKYSSVRELSMPISEIVYEAGIFPEYFEGFEKRNGRAEREKKRRSGTLERIFIVPMPTSRKHIRERGFDHIDRVAREIERISGERVERLRILERAKDTVQVGADEETRKRQAKEAVRVSPRFLGEDGKVLEEYSGQRLVILDDVWTTGASLTEAGKLLKRAGVKKVDAFAITKNRQGRSPMIRGEDEMFWGV